MHSGPAKYARALRHRVGAWSNGRKPTRRPADHTPPASVADGYRCPVCASAVEEWQGGAAGSTSATCPHCRSVPRQRHLAVLLDRLGPYVSTANIALEYAPTRLVRSILQDRIGNRYVGFDLAQHRLVDVMADALRLPFPDDAIDLIICFHVLEHIPQDDVAISELHRVTRPGGCALVQCPWRPNVPTDEDPDAPPAERKRRFGLEDHVRFYGADFTERLAAPGFRVELLRAGDYLGTVLCDTTGIPATSPIWFCRKG